MLIEKKESKALDGRGNKRPGKISMGEEEWGLLLQGRARPGQVKGAPGKICSPGGGGAKIRFKHNKEGAGGSSGFSSHLKKKEGPEVPP